MSEPCVCPVAGYCERHRRQKHARHWQLCQGINCTIEQSEKRRTQWDRELFSGEFVQAQRRDTPLISRTKEPQTFQAIPRDQWPTAASLIAALASPEDRGVGDTIKRHLGTAGEIYQAAFRLLTGLNCKGCGFRQSKWNQLYPYVTGEARVNR